MAEQQKSKKQLRLGKKLLHNALKEFDAAYDCNLQKPMDFKKMPKMIISSNAPIMLKCCHTASKFGDVVAETVSLGVEHIEHLHVSLQIVVKCCNKL